MHPGPATKLPVKVLNEDDKHDVLHKWCSIFRTECMQDRTAVHCITGGVNAGRHRTLHEPQDTVNIALRPTDISFSSPTLQNIYVGSLTMLQMMSLTLVLPLAIPDTACSEL